MSSDFKKNLKERYDLLYTEHKRHKPVWDRISRYVGIKVDTEYENKSTTESTQLDEFVNDPTAALSVQQAADYMHGIMWGTGENAITLEPSEALLEKVDEEAVKDWFGWVTDRTLFHMNHSKSGFNSALKAYNYDQFAFGTSGVGAYLNKQFLSGLEEHALIMRNYGIDNIVIDEGKNGLVDIVMVTYQWRTNKIVEEFCFDENGQLDKEQFARLPYQIQTDYNSNQLNTEHRIIHSIIPRDDFDPSLKGKRGTRYSGVWWKYDDSMNIFYEEDYAVFPVPIARAIKVRGEIYGRASGTMIISTIASVDYMVSQTFQILEKMQSPPLGTWNSALFGDNVLDTSADGLTAFNQEMLGSAQSPVFQVQDIGDPTGIINFLIPYLNEKIATAFKVDILLDFNAKGDRTATEMLQRSIIRGKNLSGMLNQQKVEMYDRFLDRCISLLWQLNVYGIDAAIFPERAQQLRGVGREERIIPEAVIECQRQGIQWYKIRYNGEFDRLSKTEAIEKILQVINVLTAMMGLFPQISMAVDWYKMYKDFNKYLGVNYFTSEDDFKAAIEQQAQRQQALLMSQAQNQASQTDKNTADAQKMRQETM